MQILSNSRTLSLGCYFFLPVTHSQPTHVSVLRMSTTRYLSSVDSLVIKRTI